MNKSKIEWTESGRAFWLKGRDADEGGNTPEDMTAVEKAIEGLEWIYDLKASLPMMPGCAINEAIKNYRIPKVSRIAHSPALAPLGFVAITGQWANEKRNIYIIDEGCSILCVGTEVVL